MSLLLRLSKRGTSKAPSAARIIRPRWCSFLFSSKTETITRNHVTTLNSQNLRAVNMQNKIHLLDASKIINNLRPTNRLTEKQQYKKISNSRFFLPKYRVSVAFVPSVIATDSVTVMLQRIWKYLFSPQQESSEENDNQKKTPNGYLFDFEDEDDEGDVDELENDHPHLYLKQRYELTSALSPPVAFTHSAMAPADFDREADNVLLADEDMWEGFRFGSLKLIGSEMMITHNWDMASSNPMYPPYTYSLGMGYGSLSHLHMDTNGTVMVAITPDLSFPFFIPYLSAFLHGDITLQANVMDPRLEWGWGNSFSYSLFGNSISGCVDYTIHPGRYYGITWGGVLTENLMIGLEHHYSQQERITTMSYFARYALGEASVASFAKNNRSIIVHYARAVPDRSTTWAASLELVVDEHSTITSSTLFGANYEHRNFADTHFGYAVCFTVDVYDMILRSSFSAFIANIALEFAAEFDYFHDKYKFGFETQAEET